LRIVLFGSSDFALPLLEALHKSNHELVAVYTQPPSISGRGLRLKYGRLGKRAQDLFLNVFHPDAVNDDQVLDHFSNLSVDVAIVASYGQILSTNLLSLPKFGFLNLHPSLLPRWRGAAPVPRAIIAGDRMTGVCTIRMVKKLDAGPILAQEKVMIEPGVTSTHLLTLLSKIGAKQVMRILDTSLEAPGIPQLHTGITYANKIEKIETRINWSLPANIIERLIRGLSSIPCAWCLIDNARVKIITCSVVNLQGSPGSRILAENEPGSLIVACGENSISISCIQREGKKPVFAEEFLRGYRGDFNFS
jgi:methionyl-tRNA formyltransferase